MNMKTIIEYRNTQGILKMNVTSYNVLIPMLIIILLINFCCCQSSKPQGRPCRIITLECPNEAWSEEDVSHLFKNEVNITALETTDSCLVRADDFKILTSNYIYIVDRITKKVFAFDWDGNFVKAIGKIGRGPGEYTDLSGLCVIRDTLYIHDQVQSKLIAYPVGDGLFHETMMEPPIYSSELTAVRNNFYFITNYSNGYNLISMDAKNHSMQYFLPYDSKIERRGSWWGLNRYSSVYQDSLIFTFSHNDTIYGMHNGMPFPFYYLDFSHNKIPGKFLENKGTKILQTALRDGYITGVDEIYNAKSYLLGNFSKGDMQTSFIYSKKRNNVLLAQSLVLNSLGKLSLNNYMPTDNDELVFFYDALLLKQLWELILSKNDFQNQEVKERLKQIIQNAKDDDNPIMFKLKFKE